MSVLCRQGARQKFQPRFSEFVSPSQRSGGLLQQSGRLLEVGNETNEVCVKTVREVTVLTRAKKYKSKACLGE